MAVRLSALRAGHLFTSQNITVLLTNVIITHIIYKSFPRTESPCDPSALVADEIKTHDYHFFNKNVCFVWLISSYLSVTVPLWSW
jgi:hypothetical protein